MISEPTGSLSSVERTFPVWGGPAERLRFLLSYAVLAPSRHNSQPWAFEIEGDEVRVYADTTRALPVVDPDGRELTMACGAAIVNLRVAAAHFGHATSVELLREHRRDGLLARIRLEERRATTPEQEELFQAIPRRHTNRLPLDGREPPEGLVAQLVREARGEGVWLRPVEEHERHEVAEIVAEGDRRLCRSQRYRAELAAWTRSNAVSHRDGMPGWAHGMGDTAARLQPFLVRLRDTSAAEAERDRRRALGTRALLLLATARDGKGEWIAAGEALQRVLLRATASGLSASYFGQAVELPDLRERLRRAVGEAGMPQVMFRLGYGLEVRPTPRRAVDDVIRRLEIHSRRPQALARREPGVATPPPVSAPGDAAAQTFH